MPFRTFYPGMYLKTFLHSVSVFISFHLIRIKSLDPLRAKNIFIRKEEDGPYLGFSYKSLISDPIRSSENTLNWQI